MRYLSYRFATLTLLAAVMTLTACSSGSRKAFLKGETLEKDGKFEEAMYSYAEAFKVEPTVGEYRVRFLKMRDRAAEQRFKKGGELFDRDDFAAAAAEFQAALGLDPTQARFKQRADAAVRLRDAQAACQEGFEFEKANKFKDAISSFARGLELNPDNKSCREAQQRVAGKRKSKLEGYELNLKSAKPITLKFKDAKIKDVFSIVTQLSGINFIFDEGIKDQQITVYLENATFQQTLDLLTNLFKLGRKVLNESTVIIYPRTPDKAKQYEDMVLRTIHLNHMDAKKAVNLVRTMIQVRKIYVNEDSNSLVVRDTADVVDVVEKILDANDVPEPEVILDVEVMEISDKNAENLGLLLSNYNVQLGAFTPEGKMLAGSLSAATAAAGTTTTTSADTTNLIRAFSMRGYGGFVTVPSAQYNFGKTLANGQVLSNPKIRVKNKEKSKFNVGTRVPITTTTLNGTLSQVNVQYVDVGVKVNAEPSIQLGNEVSIKLSLEVSSILSKEIVGGSTSPTSVVTIGTRNIDTVLSLKDGETSVIGGLIQNTASDSKQKIFLLGDLPLIGPLISGHDTTKDKTELILAITPRLVRSVTVPKNSLMSFGSGKEDEPSLVKPMASFDQEPVFEGEEKPAAAKAPTKPAVPGTAAPGAAAPPKGGEPAKPAGTPAVKGGGTTFGTSASPSVTAPVPVPAAPSTAAPAATVPAATAPAATASPAASIPPAAAPGVQQPQQPGTAPAAGSTAATPPVPGQGAAAGGQTTGTQAPAAASPKPVPTAVAKRSLVQIAAPAEIGMNQQFYTDIKTADVQDLAGAMLVLSFDPKIVDYVSATEGPFLKKDGKPTTFSASVNIAEGSLTVKLGRAPNNGGVSGAGALFSALFRAKNKGAASFNFQSVSFSAADGRPLETLPFSTAVNVK